MQSRPCAHTGDAACCTPCASLLLVPPPPCGKPRALPPPPCLGGRSSKSRTSAERSLRIEEPRLPVQSARPLRAASAWSKCVRALFAGDATEAMGRPSSLPLQRRECSACTEVLEARCAPSTTCALYGGEGLSRRRRKRRQKNGQPQRERQQDPKNAKGYSEEKV